MTLEDLKAFVKAYETRNFSEAARQLDCTQAAVAQHVKRLEKELGAELFIRAPRGVVPTDTGTSLYNGASSALQTLQATLLEIDGYQQQRDQRLYLTVSNATAVSPILRPAILKLHREYPYIDLKIIPANTAAGRISALQQGKADLGLMPKIEPIAGLEIRAATEITLELLVNHQHKFAKRKRLNPLDLNEIHYIAQGENSATYQHIQTVLDGETISLQPQLIVEDASSANLLVELNKGVTFVPQGVARMMERNQLVKGIKLPWLPPLPIVWVARSFSSLPQAAQIFLRVYDELK